MDDAENAIEDPAVSQSEEFGEDDVFFECPRCGKSMAISKTGIGKIVQCAGCGLDVIVPAPGEEAEYVEPDSDIVPDDSSETEPDDASYGGDANEHSYRLSRERRDFLFDEIAAIQRSLDRLVAFLDGLEK